MALAAECFVPQLGCEALYPVSGARVPHHHPSPHLPTTSVPSLSKEYTIPKDYSIPLHVDCSVEYDLPECAKPPQGVKIEPLLMIHPSHFRRLDSLRRCPFVNNLPSTKNNYDFTSSTTRNNTNNCTSSNTSSSCQYPQNVRVTRSSARNNKIKESPSVLPNNGGIQQHIVASAVNVANKRWNTTSNNGNILTNKHQQQNCCGNTNNKTSVQYGQPNHQIHMSRNIINSNSSSNLIQPSSNMVQYRVADVPDPYWSGATAQPYAPKEGDTLENSSFGKYPKYRSMSRLRSHPYSSALEPSCATPIVPTNCDNLIVNNNHLNNNINNHTTTNNNNNNKTFDALQGNLNGKIVSPFHAKMFTSNDTNAMYQSYPFSYV